LNAHSLYPAGSSITVEMNAEWDETGRLYLWSVTTADFALIKLPSVADSVRSDNLWKTTCFEIFLKLGYEYLEFNVSPSSEWAAYHFSSYRADMRDVSLRTPPEIHQDSGRDWFELEAWIELPEKFIGRGALKASLSAVIEETDGTKSYWALRHPPGAPDFHHPDCFALTLEAPDPA
jgi:hypothetical protein